MNPYKQEQAEKVDKKRNDALKEMQALLKAGKRFEAIKAYKAATGCSLQQAICEAERAS